MSDHKKSGEGQVRDWLRTQGYPLEFEAARILRSAGFRTVQGWSYRGEDASGLIKAREIDVYATLRGKVGGDQDEKKVEAAQFTVAAETKHTTAPWVVLTTEHPADWTPLATGWMEHLLERVGVSPQAAFPLPARTGFWAKTATGKGADLAREALMQATNAAASSVDRGGYSGPPPEWALPLVVVRDSLFTLGYTSRGGELLEEVPWCRMVWHGADAFPKPTLVDVVTRSYLRRYVRDLKVTATTIIRTIDATRARENAASERERARRLAEARARSGNG